MQIDRQIDLISPQWKTHGSNSQISASVVLLVGRQTCPPTEQKMFSVTRSTLNGISCSQPVPVSENAAVSCLPCTSHFCPIAAHILPRNHAELLRVPSLPVHQEGSCSSCLKSSSVKILLWVVLYYQNKRWGHFQGQPRVKVLQFMSFLMFNVMPFKGNAFLLNEGHLRFRIILSCWEMFLFP